MRDQESGIKGQEAEVVVIGNWVSKDDVTYYP
jgi:hypothetical protein